MPRTKSAVPKSSSAIQFNVSEELVNEKALLGSAVENGLKSKDGKKSKKSPDPDFKAQLWATADQLRGAMDASEY